ncbi:MAG: ATP-dependent endonuclease [Vicingaceae bacterium]
MEISKINIQNFRLLRDTTLDLKSDISLLIGKNNTGKTSLIEIFKKFFSSSSAFNYHDFSLELRKEILSIDENSDPNKTSIKLCLEISYNESDDLSNISELMLDLDPKIKNIKLFFECSINIESLLEEIKGLNEEDKKRIIIKNISSHLTTNIYTIDVDDMKSINSLDRSDSNICVEKDLKAINELINAKFINAQRNVTSTDSIGKKQQLSTLTTNYFNRENELSNESIKEVNEILLNLDKDLDQNYDTFFSDFLKNAKSFLDIQNLKVKSDINSKVLFENSSQVIYGDDSNHLPENMNGLGYMNILFLILAIEIKKKEITEEGRDLNLLFIEEPEAHTHPQMQYVFAREIQKIIGGSENLQTVITSHSPHIVSQSNFECIRYLRCEDGTNIVIKNFNEELEKEYKDEPSHFKFIKQYITVESAELFFAKKIIFIEGVSERILLPYFIKKLDEKKISNKEYVPIMSQNITILEVGANAKVFEPLLKFLDTPTLIITDIDTAKQEKKNEDSPIRSHAHAVEESDHTTNNTLKHFYNSPKLNDESYSNWFQRLKENKLDTGNERLLVAYQTKESDYYARSFEDAFINVNLETIKSKKDTLTGLKSIEKLDEENITPYELANEIIDKKSDFSASVLYHAFSDESTEWNIPEYILKGLKWIQSDE